MITVKIMCELLQDSIWVLDDENIILENGLPVINNDYVIQELNKNITDLYHECIDEGKISGYEFNETKARENKHKMLDLLKQLIDKLSELNDGSFVVEDCETEYWKSI